MLLRVAEVRRLLTILERSQKSHPLLVGEAGVGKSAVVRALSQRIAAGDVPTSLASTRLLELDSGALLSGARLRGEIEERVKKLLSDVQNRAVILVIRNIEQLFGQGPGATAIGDVLKPALSRAELRLLATTTPEGLKRLEERDPQVLRSFTQLPIAEPSIEQAIEIVRGIATRYERHHGVEIGEAAIRVSVQLAKRYVQDRALPDSAIDLLDEASARKRVEIDGVSGRGRTTRFAAPRVAARRSSARSLAATPSARATRAKAKLDKEIAELEAQRSGPCASACRHAAA